LRIDFGNCCTIRAGAFCDGVPDRLPVVVPAPMTNGTSVSMPVAASRTETSPPIGDGG
jgi:hypothetical protein